MFNSWREFIEQLPLDLGDIIIKKIADSNKSTLKKIEYDGRIIKQKILNYSGAGAVMGEFLAHIRKNNYIETNMWVNDGVPFIGLRYLFMTQGWRDGVENNKYWGFDGELVRESYHPFDDEWCYKPSSKYDFTEFIQEFNRAIDDGFIILAGAWYETGCKINISQYLLATTSSKKFYEITNKITTNFDDDDELIYDDVYTPYYSSDWFVDDN